MRREVLKLTCNIAWMSRLEVYVTTAVKTGGNRKQHLEDAMGRADRHQFMGTMNLTQLT